MMKEKLRIKTKDIALIGLMLSIIEGVKISLSFIPSLSFFATNYSSECSVKCYLVPFKSLLRLLE